MAVRSSSSKPIQLKLVVIGNAHVGKSSLIHRWVTGTSLEDSKPTVGLEYFCRNVELEEDRVARVIVWDTAGEERYRALRGAHYRNTNAAVIVYDLTDQHSFEAVKTWLEELRSVTFPGIKVVLVGNKSDLSDKINTGDLSIQQFAEANGFCGFFKCSAKMNQYVSEAFYCAVEEAVKWMEKEKAQVEYVVNSVMLSGTKTNRAFGCCQ